MAQPDSYDITDLVRRYSGRIYGVALRLTRNQADAEDVLQETFLTVIRKLDAFEGRSSIYTWMHRIATNIALGKLRKLSSKPDVDLSPQDFDNLTSMDPDQWGGEDLFTGQPTDYLQSAIETAVSSLPESQRLVFVLRDAEGLSTRETAEALGLSESNVKVRLMRARISLRNALAHVYQANEGRS